MMIGRIECESCEVEDFCGNLFQRCLYDFPQDFDQLIQDAHLEIAEAKSYLEALKAQKSIINGGVRTK